MTISQSSTDSYKSSFYAQGVTDSSGSCTIQLPQIPGGSYATGTILVFDSPNAIRWTLTVNGITKDLILGPASTAGIQIGVGDILQLTATGLVSGSIYHATFDAVVSPENDTNLVSVAHDPLFINGSNLNEVIETIPTSVVPTTVSVPVPINVASLTLFFEPGFMTGNGLFSVTGATTGVIYYSNFALADAQTMISPVSFDVSPDVDPVLSFNFSNATNSPLYVRANSELSFSNTPSGPLFIAKTDPAPRLPFIGTMVNILAAGANQLVLPAPTIGFYNEIKSIMIQGATAAAAATLARIFGATTGAFILGGFSQANGFEVSQSYEDFFITEALNGTNSTAVTCSFSVWSRQVPIASSY